ncbi:MAG: thioredoxin family protein [Casimicrobiaceae bacterium]
MPATATSPDAPSAGEVVELDAARFGALIPSHRFAIIDFWAPWCAPCRAFAPVFTEAAKRHPDLLFAKVNTEDEQALAGHFNIRSIPTLMIFRENVVIFSQAGALSAGSLEEVLAAARGLDMDEVRREIEAGESHEAAPGATGQTDG